MGRFIAALLIILASITTVTAQPRGQSGPSAEQHRSRGAPQRARGRGHGRPHGHFSYPRPGYDPGPSILGVIIGSFFGTLLRPNPPEEEEYDD